jgi:hypothetical protein
VQHQLDREPARDRVAEQRPAMEDRALDRADDLRVGFNLINLLL